MPFESILLHVGHCSFELTQSVRRPSWFTVIAAHEPKSSRSNAEQLVGITFHRGENPAWRPAGLAQSLQKALNRTGGAHATF
jgi:hypothetical protein